MEIVLHCQQKDALICYQFETLPDETTNPSHRPYC